MKHASIIYYCMHSTLYMLRFDGRERFKIGLKTAQILKVSNNLSGKSLLKTHKKHFKFFNNLSRCVSLIYVYWAVYNTAMHKSTWLRVSAFMNHQVHFVQEQYLKFYISTTQDLVPSQFLYKSVCVHNKQFWWKEALGAWKWLLSQLLIWCDSTHSHARHWSSQTITSSIKLLILEAVNNLCESSNQHAASSVTSRYANCSHLKFHYWKQQRRYDTL